MAAAAAIVGVTALAPLIVRLIEMAKGGRRSPEDTQTGLEKQNAGIAIIQILDALRGEGRTAEEAAALLADNVTVMNIFGQLPKPGAPPGKGKPPVAAVPLTFTGTITIGGPR